MAADHYKTMGLERNATAEQIKAAWKRLVVELHPDKDGGDAAKFTKLQEAYAVLSDPVKRETYDLGDQVKALELIDALLEGMVSEEAVLITDAIGLMRVNLVELIDDSKKTRKHYTEVRGRMWRVIKRTKNPSALLVKAMTKKLADLDRQVELVDANLVIMRKAVDILEGATYDVSISGEFDIGSPLFGGG